MKKTLYIFATAIVMMACGKQVIVYNESEIPRKGEIVEVDLYELSEGEENDFAVINSNGDTITSQITYDDKLIFPADVPAMGKSSYRIEKVLTQTLQSDSSIYDWQNGTSLRIAVISEGEAIFSEDINKIEILDNGPLRYTAFVHYYPIPVDTMWVKQKRYISVNLANGERNEKVWFEDLKGEHEIMAALEVDGDGTDNISQDSLSFSHNGVSFRFEDPLHNLGYIIFDHMYLAGFCTKEGPEPLEYIITDKTAEKIPSLEIEICGSGK